MEYAYAENSDVNHLADPFEPFNARHLIETGAWKRLSEKNMERVFQTKFYALFSTAHAV